MEIGETDTERGPVVGLKHREEVVDRRAVSTTHTHTHERNNTNRDMSAHTHTQRKTRIQNVTRIGEGH